MSPSDDSRPSLFRRPAFVVGLNLALLGVLVLLVVAGSPANAGSREGAAPRARGEYTMLTGRGGSGSTGLVYILDGVNAELIALRYDSRTHLSVIGYRSMDGDAKATPQR